jgi:hypothetical protein
MSGAFAIGACITPALIGGELAVSPRVLPELERDWDWIDLELLPPSRLTTRPMKLAMMDPAKRDGELIAHSVSKGTRLCKS